MYADAYFAIGARHDVCQDYALAGVAVGDTGSVGGWALVSDGCSSSPLSDFGARLLATAASRALDRLDGANDSIAASLVLAHAAEMADALAISHHSLDATLCYLRQSRDAAHAHIIGDGVVAARRRDGAIEAWHVSDSHSAPAYLSYMLDDKRLAAYLAQHGARTIEHYLDGRLLSRDSHHLRDAPYAVHVTLPSSDYALAMVLSDGAASFHEGVDPVPLCDVLAPLMAFKSHRGRFVTRRMRRFLKREASRRGWRHDDDIAAAAVVMS